MNKFVNGNAYKASKRSVTCYKRSHTILHATIAALNYHILIVRILTVILIDKLKALSGQFRELFPAVDELFLHIFRRIFGYRICLVEKSEQRTIRHLNCSVSIIRIGCPHHIMHIVRCKVPCEFFTIGTVYLHSGRFVSISYFLRILKVGAGANYVIAIYMNGDVKCAKRCKEFPADVRIRMPAPLAVCCNFWIPLRHRKPNAFGIVATRSTGLKRHLCLVLHLKFYNFPGKNRLCEVNLHDSALNSKVYLSSILFDPVNSLIADFSLIVSQYFVADTSVRICNRP